MEANETSDMSVTVLKKQLIDKLKEVNDEDILEDVLAFIEFEVSSDKNVHLSPDQISRIEESRKQIKSGKSLTQEDVEQRNSCRVYVSVSAPPGKRSSSSVHS